MHQFCLCARVRVHAHQPAELALLFSAPLWASPWLLLLWHADVEVEYEDLIDGAQLARHTARNQWRELFSRRHMPQLIIISALQVRQLHVWEHNSTHAICYAELRHAVCSTMVARHDADAVVPCS